MSTAFTGRLTEAQITEVAQIGDEWMRIALSTDRCDRAAAETAVYAAYAAAGLSRPPLTIWMDSPLGGVYAKTVLGQLLVQDGGQLRGQLRDQLRGQLQDQLRGQLMGQLRDQIWGQLGGQLGDQLWDQLGGQLQDQLGGQLQDQLRGQLRDQLDPWFESYWLAFYERALTYAGLPRSPRLDSLIVAIRETGWWWPMHGAVVLTDRPTALHRDPQGRLHADGGPALAYADGYGGHWWHGVGVPADLVTGDGWQPDRILRERNTEIRRCAIEKRGWDRFVHDAGLTRVASAADPGNPGHNLDLYDLPRGMSDLYDEPARILLVANASLDRDGTRRRFGLPVPADISDPLTAAAALFDVSPVEYAALARAT